MEGQCARSASFAATRRLKTFHRRPQSRGLLFITLFLAALSTAVSRAQTQALTPIDPFAARLAESSAPVVDAVAPNFAPPTPSTRSTPVFFASPYEVPAAPVYSSVDGPVDLASYAQPKPAPAPGSIEEYVKKMEARLVDVEGKLKKRDENDKKEAEKKAASEYPSARITGFTQLDGCWFNQDPNSIATVGNGQDGVGFRRARFAFVGKVAEFTNYMFEFDFATAGHPSFFDVWVEQTNLPVLGNIRAGQYCQPFSVDALTGFRNLTFLERSLPFLAFVPFRRVGVMSYNSNEDQTRTWATSVFKTGGFLNAPLGDDRFATDIGDMGGYSFSTRATQLLYYDEPTDGRYVWHVGGSFDYSRLTANTAAGSTTNVPFYQARTTPEFGPIGNTEVSQNFGQAFAFTPVFVDTGRYRADSFNIYGLETVYQAGPLGFTSEFMATVVDSEVGPITYTGAYGQLAYRLTGENRVYDKKTGTLGKVIPYADFFSLTKGHRGFYGWGAWEIAGRWSYVNLNNPMALNPYYLNGTSNVGNGVLNDSTVGLTWFINAYTKVQFNWIHAMLNNKVRGHSDADLFVTRLQVDY